MGKSIECLVSMLAGKDGLTLKLEDETSGMTFLTLHMSAENFSAALGRLCCLPADSCEVRNLEKLGKKHEHKTIDFPIGDMKTTGDYSKLAREKIKDVCPEGWTPELGFNSHGSIFVTEGILYGRTIIRRWV